jgi:hypothetical protein
MKKTLGTLLALALFAGPVAAFDRPDFSGDWKMNAAKSTFGSMPAPSTMTRKVTHAEPSLLIVEEQTGGMGSGNIRKYTTDGKETSFQSDGADVATSAVWDGDAIVVASNVAIAGLQFVDRMTLSDGGKTLTSAVHISTPQGDLDITIVFDRQ